MEQKIRPQRGALNEGSRPADRLLMKYSCKEWSYLSIYLAIYPSILPTTFPHFLLLLSTILWYASFVKKKEKKTSTLSLVPQKQTISTLSQETLREFSDTWLDFQPSSQNVLFFGRSSVCLGKCSQHMTANCTFTSAACMGNHSLSTIP